MTPPTLDIVQWSTAIAVGLAALGKAFQVITRGSVSTRDSEAARIAAQWKRLEDMNDDLRADNDRLRQQMRERDEEITRLRRLLEACLDQRRPTRKRSEDG